MRRKIKIAHVIGSLNFGGAESQVVKILNGLDSNVYEKFLITLSPEQAGLSKCLSPNISFYYLECTGFKQFYSIVKMKRLFQKLNIDIVHSHMYHTTLYASIACKLAGIKVLLTTEHGMNLWKKAHHHFFERYVINRIAKLRIAVSKDILELRIRDDHVSREKIIFMENCVDIPIFQPHGKKNHTGTVIGTVGRMVPVKNYQSLLRAFKLVSDAHQDARLLFVGEGPELDRLKKLAVDLGIIDKVEFVGWQVDVVSFLRQMDIFVLSSLREGIPVAMLEAMALGIPVVATRVGGIPEVIVDQQEGTLVESDNPEQLSQAIASYLDNDAKRASHGMSGQQKVIRRFSTQTVCKKYDLIYQKLLDGDHRVI